MNQVTIHGHTVNYEDNVSSAVRYLRDQLDFYEARVFFDAARQYGSAPFEDQDYRQNYTLYHGSNGYTIERR